MRYRLILPVAILSMTLAGCIDSTNPVFGPDSRVLPLPSPAKFEMYERAGPAAPWRLRGRFAFVADQSLVVREVDDGGTPQGSTSYTFHPLGPRRFLVQADFGDIYAYAVLEVRPGEAIVFSLNCDKIDQQAFRAAGGTVISGQPPGDKCRLDNVSDPLKLLSSIAVDPVGPQHKYVPVR